MALLLADSYYKINFDGSYIQDNNVHIAIIIYKNIFEREKAKDRLESINHCVDLIEEKLNRPATLSEEQLEELDRVLYCIKHYSQCIFSNRCILPEWSTETKILLLQYGYQDEWLDDPVLLEGEFNINCGAWDISWAWTIENLYQQLKKHLSIYKNV